MAKKNNLKSVRLSDQVMDYVINFEGDGFNQKFENLVLFCMEQEETRKQKIAFLDQQIVKQYKKLDTLRQLISQLSARLSWIWNGGQMTCLHLWMNCWKIKTRIRNFPSPDLCTVSQSRVSVAHSSRPLTDWTQPVQRIRQEGWEACRVSILLDYPHVLLS